MIRPLLIVVLAVAGCSTIAQTPTRPEEPEADSLEETIIELDVEMDLDRPVPTCRPGMCEELKPTDYWQALDDLQAARALWKARPFTDYTMTVRGPCGGYGCDGPVIVTTQDYHASGTQDGTVVSADQVHTVVELFSYIEEACWIRLHRVEVTYDRVLGYPIEVNLGEDFGSHFGIRFFVSDFAPLDS